MEVNSYPILTVGHIVRSIKNLKFYLITISLVSLVLGIVFDSLYPKEYSATISFQPVSNLNIMGKVMPDLSLENYFRDEQNFLSWRLRKDDNILNNFSDLSVNKKVEGKTYRKQNNEHKFVFSPNNLKVYSSNYEMLVKTISYLEYLDSIVVKDLLNAGETYLKLSEEYQGSADTLVESIARDALEIRYAIDILSNQKQYFKFDKPSMIVRSSSSTTMNISLSIFVGLFLSILIVYISAIYELRKQAA